jgi:lipoprotein-anchoring transpeptidase ErfK/SrfK
MGVLFSRRDFLKLGAMAAASSAFLLKSNADFVVTSSKPELVRVATTQLSVYNIPCDDTTISTILYQRSRDEIVHTYYEVQSKYPPASNTKWYRVWGGYLHSAHLQPVQNIFNDVVWSFPTQGSIAQVTVPLTQSMWKNPQTGWEKIYRLYYNSVHWVTGVTAGPDGYPWYIIKDRDLSNINYFVRAEHLRVIPPEEYSPLSTEVPETKKSIIVNVNNQSLQALEYDQVVFQTNISSGMAGSSTPDGSYSTDTPRGYFNVFSKMPSKHMGLGEITSDPEAYVLPGVPWTSFFVENIGVAFHGTYWHDNYGNRMSHGCINMKPAEALWLFRWCTPVFKGDKMEQTGNGTRVSVI